jgi:hypothetical protein
MLNYRILVPSLSPTRQNFYPGVTTVTIGGVPCTSPNVTDTTTLQAVVCTAPGSPGLRDTRLQVFVAGGGSAAVPFLYTAPEVTGLSAAVCAADANVPIRVSGTNMGSRSLAAGSDPVVFIGGAECTQPVLLSDTVVQCTVMPAPVGVYPVVGTWGAPWCSKEGGGTEGLNLPVRISAT